MTLALVLLILWALGFFVFKTVGAIIHVLLIVAVISFLLHVIRGRKTS